MHDEVVDAHGDEIDPNHIVYAGFDCDFDLGADPIISGNKERIAKACRLKIENASEAANFGIGTAPSRRPHDRLDFFDHCIACIDIDASIGIGEAILVCHIAPGAKPALARGLSISRPKEP